MPVWFIIVIILAFIWLLVESKGLTIQLSNIQNTKEG
jgi:hypothetical protein